MQTANTASLLVKSSLASVGTVQLATPARYCDATCIRCLTPSGTVGSSITLALSSMHCSVVKQFSTMEDWSNAQMLPMLMSFNGQFVYIPLRGPMQTASSKYQPFLSAAPLQHDKPHTARNRDSSGNADGNSEMR